MNQLPFVIGAFASPVVDNPQAQVAICAVLLLIALDVVFGLVNALVHHEYSSEKMRQGIAHKAVEMCFVCLGIIIDTVVTSGIDLGFTAPVLVSVCVYIIVMEVGSLMETSVKIWPKLEGQPAFRLLKSARVIAPEEVGGSD